MWMKNCVDRECVLWVMSCQQSSILHIIVTQCELNSLQNAWISAIDELSHAIQQLTAICLLSHGSMSMKQIRILNRKAKIAEFPTKIYSITFWRPFQEAIQSQRLISSWFSSCSFLFRAIWFRFSCTLRVLLCVMITSFNNVATT